jgi:rare lipoprotein A
MPIFGLVWVASWVGCFFPSSQEMLQPPSYPACVLSAQPADSPNRSLKQPVSLTAKLQPVVNPASLPQAKRQKMVPNSARTGRHGTAQTSTPKGFLPTRSVSSVRNFSQTSQVQSPLESSHLLLTFRNLLSGVQASFKIPDSPQVAVAVVARRAVSGRLTDTRQSGSEQCALMPDSGKSPVAKPPEHFQVRFKGRIVGEAADQQQAQLIAQQLEQWLADPDLERTQLQPGLVDGMPAVKLGDRVLFSLNRALVQNEHCNLEMLAIQWANNLRTALSEPPLTLVEAQERIYGLEATGEVIQGLASWYGPYFHGRQTATGEVYDQNDFTAAHPSLPFDTYLKVTNQLNDKSVIVRINDRGPYIDDRTLDLSREAARYLDSETSGVVPVEAVIMKPRPVQASQTVANSKL